MSDSEEVLASGLGWRYVRKGFCLVIECDSQEIGNIVLNALLYRTIPNAVTVNPANGRMSKKPGESLKSLDRSGTLDQLSDGSDVWCDDCRKYVCECKPLTDLSYERKAELFHLANELDSHPWWKMSYKCDDGTILRCMTASEIRDFIKEK